MTHEPINPAQRAHGHRFTLWMLLYGAAILGGAIALKNLSPPQWGVILIALAPGAFALMALMSWLHWFAALDEVQRAMHGQAMLISLGIVAIASLSYGFLEQWAGFPRFPIVFFAPAFCVVVSLVRPFVERRYK